MSELSKYIDKSYNFQKIKLLDGRSVGIRKWTMGEEKDFLFAVESRRNILNDDESGEDITIEESVKLVKKCIDKDIVDVLSEANLIYLLAELRKISKGVEIDFGFRCMNKDCLDFVILTPERQKKEGVEGYSRTLFDEVIKLDGEEVKIRRLNTEPISINGFKYYFKEIPYIVRKKLDDTYLKKLEVNRWTYYFVLNSIEAIEPEETSKKITDFTLDELMEWVDRQIDSKQFKTLSDAIGNQICDYKISKNVTCPICKNESEVVYDDLFGLMVF